MRTTEAHCIICERKTTWDDCGDNDWVCRVCGEWYLDCDELLTEEDV